MKLKVGNFYKLLAASGLDRGGQWECIKIERNKAYLKQESLVVVNIPCSLVFIRPTSQVFINYKHKNKEEIMEKNEVESYADAKEYLIAKGLYGRVLGIDWDYVGVKSKGFVELFIWNTVEEGSDFWEGVYDELRALGIHNKIESLVQDYKAKQGKESSEYIETQPEEVVETKPLEKPKQYLCYVQGKTLPKHTHKTLEQAKQEAQRLCRKELAKVSVLEVVAEYKAEVLVKEL